MDVVAPARAPTAVPAMAASSGRASPPMAYPPNASVARIVSEAMIEVGKGRLAANTTRNETTITMMATATSPTDRALVSCSTSAG